MLKATSIFASPIWVMLGLSGLGYLPADNIHRYAKMCKYKTTNLAAKCEYHLKWSTDVSKAYLRFSEGFPISSQLFLVNVSLYVSPFPTDLLSDPPDSISQSLVMLRSVCRMSAFTIRKFSAVLFLSFHSSTAVSLIHWSSTISPCHPSELDRSKEEKK